MARSVRRTGSAARSAQTLKYDAHHEVMEETYGELADLRKALSDSPGSVKDRERLLRQFAECEDPQKAWLALEDYFDKLSLARKDFQSGNDWWSRVMAVSGAERLTELSMLFLRSDRSLPPELLDFADFDRFAELEEAESSEEIAELLEGWMFPHLGVQRDTARATLRVVADCINSEEAPGLYELGVTFYVFRPRTGERKRTVAELADITQRATQERELFSAEDWEFLVWLVSETKERPASDLRLSGPSLFHWISHWGGRRRIELRGADGMLTFRARIARLEPDIERGEDGCALTHYLCAPEGRVELSESKFFLGRPPLVLARQEIFVLGNAPDPRLLASFESQPSIPVSRLRRGFVANLYRRYRSQGEQWDEICLTHAAKPIFLFELDGSTLQVTVTAESERDGSVWRWTGEEWTREDPDSAASGTHETLDDPRLEPALDWLRQFDWFSPEPGVWQGEISPYFLERIAKAWNARPEGAEFMGDEEFSRLFINGKRLRPKVTVTGTGIDWFSVSAEWEREGAKLSARDLRALEQATDRFVYLPDAGWVELDESTVEEAHETVAEFGLDGLSSESRRVSLTQAAQASEMMLQRLDAKGKLGDLREALRHFEEVEDATTPETVCATMRPYQEEGFAFLTRLFRIGLGGVLADDMGLGKTLQTLAAIQWLGEWYGEAKRPTLVICPASVLHNWRREANRFVPKMKVLALESGPKRHNLRERIPDYDLIVTNYSLLRRDLAELKKFEFLAVVLDEAQFIKNPAAQVTRSVKQLRATRRLALTGTPLENRLLDLWSIIDFTQPGYLGTQQEFLQKYELERDDPVKWRINRRRLSAKLRAVLLRRLKKQVAADLPARIEERRDCELGVGQRRLYLAELRRSREQVQRAVSEQGAAKSKMHVLAALTRLRQICCHPKLVGSPANSGKTDAIFEILEPLLNAGEKALVFSQFVEMLGILKTALAERGIKTYLITGETKNRQEVVNAFQDEPNPAVFLLSLRAAGTGLNLTAASYVVIYDPWWNPSVEAQAIDRCHRIGQTRTVNAYRLITPGTVEEKIWELQRRKSQTITDILGEESFTKSLTAEDLDYLFAEDDA